MDSKEARFTTVQRPRHKIDGFRSAEGGDGGGGLQVYRILILILIVFLLKKTDLRAYNIRVSQNETKVVYRCTMSADNNVRGFRVEAGGWGWGHGGVEGGASFKY